MSLSNARMVVVNFPFTHGGEAKRRPALVLATDATGNGTQPYTYLVLAQVTAAPARATDLGAWDVPVDAWEQAGLHRPSIVQANRLFTVQAVNVLSELGPVERSLLDAVRERVAALLLQG